MAYWKERGEVKMAINYGRGEVLSSRRVRWMVVVVVKRGVEMIRVVVVRNGGATEIKLA